MDPEDWLGPLDAPLPEFMRSALRAPWRFLLDLDREPILSGLVFDRARIGSFALLFIEDIGLRGTLSARAPKSRSGPVGRIGNGSESAATFLQL